MEIGHCTEHVSKSNTCDFWEDFKQKLENELTQDEQRKISHLTSDIIKTMCKGRVKCENTRDLLTIMEKCMFFEDALSVLEHTFGYADHYLEYEDKSFGQLLREYRLERRKFDRSNIIGRETEIHEALKILENTDIKGLLIYGMGGLGKTLLSNEISGRMAFSRNTDVYKVDLKQVRNTPDVITSILAEFEIYTTNKDTETLISQLLYQLKTVTHDTCIVLDNMENVYQFDSEGVKHFLKICLDGSKYINTKFQIKWIITSRLQIDENTQCSEIFQMKLNPLDDRSAEKLLRLSIRPIELSCEHCQQILDMTCRNPLAIRLVSSAIKSDWQNEQNTNLSVLNQSMQMGMTECIEYAYMSLTKDEREKLISLSVVETCQFDREVVNAVLDLEDSREAFMLMMKMTNQQIVKTIWHGRYCLHPLIFAYLKNRPDYEDCTLKAQSNFYKYMVTVMDPYIQQADTDYMTAISKVNAYQPLLKILFRQLSTHTNDLFSPKVNKLLKYLKDMLPVTQIEKRNLYRNITRQMLPRRRLEAYITWKLEEISLMLDDKNLNEVEQELSALDERLCDISDGTDTNSDIKALFWYMKGRYFRFKECKEYRNAIECFKTSHQLSLAAGNVHQTARALNGLGNTYFDMKDEDNALYYHQQAFDSLRNFISNDHHPDLSNYVFNIGTIYFEKGYKDLSINRFECLTVHAKENFEKALLNFEKSMAIDERIKNHRTPKYACKLELKARALFHLYDDDRNRTKAINDMKKSLALKLAPLTRPDKNRTLACFKTGQLFHEWRKVSLKASSVNQLLLKEAIACFGMAEDEIRNSSSACLDGKDKTDFFSLYKKYASQAVVKRDKAQRIILFCQRYDGHSLTSSSDDSETDSSGGENSSSHDGNVGDAASDCEIIATKTEKQSAIQFRDDFLCMISNQEVADKA